MLLMGMGFRFVELKAVLVQDQQANAKCSLIIVHANEARETFKSTQKGCVQVIETKT